MKLRFMEPKHKRKPFASRTERSVPAAAAANGSGKGTCTNNAGDCIQWVSKDNISWRAKCGFKEDMENMGKRSKANAQVSIYTSRQHKVPEKAS